MPGSKKSAGSFQNKTILLGVTGSIAIYKACDLIRRMKEEGAQVFCLMSQGAREFMSPLVFGALSGNPVATQIWDPGLWKMSHLESAEKADLFLIAPATANCIARLAGGLADEVICATALATTAPLLIAPAMHEGMWKHPATQSNLERLKSYGYRFVGPEFGPLTRGESGWGRFSDTPAILAAAKELLQGKKPK